MVAILTKIIWFLNCGYIVGWWKKLRTPVKKISRAVVAVKLYFFTNFKFFCSKCYFGPAKIGLEKFKVSKAVFDITSEKMSEETGTLFYNFWKFLHDFIRPKTETWGSPLNSATTLWSKKTQKRANVFLHNIPCTLLMKWSKFLT